MTLTLIALAALCAWVSAQGPAPLPAEVRVKQFKANRILIKSLVDHGIDLAKADAPLARAEECRRTALTLANYVEQAAGDEDGDRVAEFAGLYGDVVRDGLVPNLVEAKKQITDPESQEAGRLKQLNDQARHDLEGVRQSIPTSGKVGDNDKVKAALAAINELTGKFGP